MALLVGAGPARAGTVAVQRGVLEVAGAGREANRVTVGAQGAALVVHDSGARLRPGPGCAALDAATTSCAAAEVVRATLRGGLGDDRLTVTAPLPALLQGGAGRDVLVGGPGRDGLQGGPDDDELRGGAGADELGGGHGLDVVSYAERTEPIRAAPNAIADDGARDEHDDLLGDVEGIEGGAGPDVLVGSPQRDLLRGGPGADRLEGGAGPDRLEGEAGRDELVGGPGADRLRAVDALADAADCGDGEDVLEADEVDRAGGCERTLRATRLGPLALVLAPGPLWVGRSGALAVSTACAAAGAGRCAGRIVVELPGRGGPKVLAAHHIRPKPKPRPRRRSAIARAGFGLAAGEGRDLGLALAPRARAALRARGRLRVVLVVRGRDARGERSEASRSVLLRADPDGRRRIAARGR